MDKRTLGTRHERRHAARPALESLEGRRLLSAGGARARIQEIQAPDGIRLVIQGTKRADLIKIEDNGTAARGNIKVTLGDGRVYVSKRAISTLSLNTLGGADQVAYSLTGDLTARRGMTVELGAGADRFDATIDKAINTTEALAIMVYGDAGNDSLSVAQTGDTVSGTFFPYLQGNDGDDVISYRGSGNIGAKAIVAPGLPGDAGNDIITAEYSGVILGTYQYNLTIDGGAGNDMLSNRITAKGGSWGKIGTDDKAPATVLGGDGDDHIDYVVTVEPSSSVLASYTSLVGGTGTDTIQRSANVKADSTTVEKDSVLS